MMRKYILDGQQPVPCDDVMTWARWHAKTNCRVALDNVCDCKVSTVFLGADHQLDDGPPLLFETMVFGGPLDHEQERYSTWIEAEDGHKAMCERVRNAMQ